MEPSTSAMSVCHIPTQQLVPRVSLAKNSTPSLTIALVLSMAHTFLYVPARRTELDTATERGTSEGLIKE